jgi:hypothetical protein
MIFLILYFLLLFCIREGLTDGLDIHVLDNAGKAQHKKIVVIEENTIINIW